jgi:hypothetical protein
MNDESLQIVGDETVNSETVTESNAEADTLRDENEALRQTLRMRDAREALTNELKASGARSPELLFESAQNDIQFDDEGKPVNIAAVAANLKHKFPEQFGADTPVSIDAGAGRTDQNNFLTREALAKMKPAEIARLNWNDVRSVLAN